MDAKPPVASPLDLTGGSVRYSEHAEVTDESAPDNADATKPNTHNALTLSAPSLLTKRHDKGAISLTTSPVANVKLGTDEKRSLLLLLSPVRPRTQTRGSIWNTLWGSGQKKSNNVANQKPKSISAFQLKTHKTRYERLGGTTSWISAAMVVYWDNIFGPRLEQVWNGTEDLSEEALGAMGRHALSGELGGDKELHIETAAESKFHVFTDSVVVALVFTAPLDPAQSSITIGASGGMPPAQPGSLTRYCFCVVIKRLYMQRLLVIHPTVLQQMFRLVNKLRALMLRPGNKHPLPDILDQFSELLPPFVNHLEYLFYSSLPQQRFTSFFCTNSLPFKSDFLTRAITSHLQTHGCTVVLGKNIELVNTFVDTLSLFLTPKEKQRSSLAYEGRPYVPDLILQGLVNQVVTEDQIIQSLLPTTVVDTDREVVQHTQVYHEYIRLRRLFMDQEIENLLSGNPDTTIASSISSVTPVGEQSGPSGGGRSGVYSQRSSNSSGDERPQTPDKRGSEPERTRTRSVSTPAPPIQLLKQLRESSPYIARLLSEAFTLTPSTREAFIMQSTQLLTRKALILIKYVDAEVKRSRAAVLDAEVIKQIRHNLELQSDADFLVLLGHSEKLQPGIYVTLAVDPIAMEERFIEFFDSWSLG